MSGGAGVAVETWGLAWRAAGVPMRVAGLGSHHATPVTVGMFAMGTMIVTFWFTFAVIMMARLSKNPRRTYLRTALPLLALSLAVPATAADTAGLDQAHPRRRAPDRRRDHHSGGREAAIATAVRRPAHPASPARFQPGHGWLVQHQQQQNSSAGLARPTRSLT